MLIYLLKRLLLFVPTLLVVSLLAFGLSRVAPGDPVLSACAGNRELLPDDYRRCAGELHLDRPAFYFSLAPASYPDTLYRILPLHRRETLRKMIALYGEWPLLAEYDRELQKLQEQIRLLPDSIDRQLRIDLRQAAESLRLASQEKAVRGQWERLQGLLAGSPQVDGLRAQLGQLQGVGDRLFEGARPNRRFWPGFHWHGLDNQYHWWLSNTLRGDFGKSYKDKRPVLTKIGEALRWTVLLNALAIALAFGLAIPLGVFAATRPDSRADRSIGLGLFALYSLPRFWVATLLIVFFTTAEYGAWLDWFPSNGLGELPDGASFFERFWVRAHHLVLPVACLAYASLAFIARQMRGSMLEVLGLDYIRTARAAGLPERRVIWRHGFRNALFPIITMIASIFPAAVAGSVVIEVIFGLPGMGWLMYDAIGAQDWPVVFSVLIFSALLTMVGILVADLLYAWADPRVALQKRKGE